MFETIKIIMPKSPSSISSTFFTLSPKLLKTKRTIHPDICDNKPNRVRNNSLEEQTINNTTIFNFNGNIYNAKIVDVDETNTLQIIFKFNNKYNIWKCKLNFNPSVMYDETLAHIYLKSFINTIQDVECFFFNKQNYLLIDIIDKVRLTSVVKFIQEKSNELKNKNNINCIHKICDKTANCVSYAVKTDIIDYDEYIFAIHGNNLSLSK